MAPGGPPQQSPKTQTGHNLKQDRGLAAQVLHQWHQALPCFGFLGLSISEDKLSPQDPQGQWEINTPLLALTVLTQNTITPVFYT